MLQGDLEGRHDAPVLLPDEIKSASKSALDAEVLGVSQGEEQDWKQRQRRDAWAMHGQGEADHGGGDGDAMCLTLKSASFSGGSSIQRSPDISI